MCSCPAGDEDFNGPTSVAALPADVAFEEILNRIGKMRPDGHSNARERYEGRRRDQHQFPCADRSDGGTAALINYRSQLRW
jgi:hypothetical protein